MGSDPSSLEEYGFAVAVHEAGHAVVATYLGFEVSELQMKGKGGRAVSGPFVAVERVDYMAPWSAGDAAVEKICGGYRLPLDTNPNSDQEVLQRIERELSATDQEKRLAHSKAREIVRAKSMHIIAVAEALLAAEDGELADEEVERLLAPVRAAK